MQSTGRESLSRDIRLLGDLLGETILRLAGKEAFQLEESVRSETKSLRQEPSIEAARQLIDRLDSLDLPTLRTLIRAFSVYFDLINLAEQHARVRSLRGRAETNTSSPIAESLREAIAALPARGIGSADVRRFLLDADICPVFTAHPTEARRRTLLEKLVRISHSMERLEREALLPRERESRLGEIREEIEALWLSDTVRRQRPAVIDEVRQGLRLLELTLFDVVPDLYRELESALAQAYPDAKWDVPALLRFGSWIGGDRDGNPYVTPGVTVDAVALQVTTVLTHYGAQLSALAHKLSYSVDHIQPPAELLQSLAADDLEDRVACERFAKEPFRRKCLAMQARIERTIEHVARLRPRWLAEESDPPPQIYFGKARLLADMRLLAQSLGQAGALEAANRDIKNLCRLVEAFGVHMLTLDVRQHAVRHRVALAEILAWAGIAADYNAMTPTERLKLLESLLENPRPVTPTHLPFSASTIETVETFRTIAAILRQVCPEAIDKYIISMVEEPADILAVLLLARDAGLFDPGIVAASPGAAANDMKAPPQTAFSKLDIVPLFETIHALRQGPEIISALVELPIYRRHLKLRSDVQEVMLGYSDSNKESGFLQSVWSLYRVEEILAEFAVQSGLTVQMFHGRGGSIGRGGGPANRAILAQPRGAVHGRLRFTEQGEVIADRYGNPAIAERHLEQVLNAIVLAHFSTGLERPSEHWIKLVDKLADAACTSYRALVYETPEFIDYFQAATPIREISELRLGSRPVRRTGKSGIEDLRAIPWVFSWMQSRHALPGWYGLGTAFEEIVRDTPDALDQMRAMYARWPFWTTTVDNVQMILAKADMTIARLYADLVEDKAVGDRIFARIEKEYRLSVEAVLRITSQSSLLECMPVLQRSIQQRNPYVDPLSFIQLVLIRRLRRAPGGDSQVVIGVLESIAGIAAGLKNTG